MCDLEPSMEGGSIVRTRRPRGECGIASCAVQAASAMAATRAVFSTELDELQWHYILRIDDGWFELELW